MKHFQFQADQDFYNDDSSLNLLLRNTKDKCLQYATDEEIEELKESTETPSTTNQIDPDQYLFSLPLRYYPTIYQEQFIRDFISNESLTKIKLGLCQDIVNDFETINFEEWVNQLHYLPHQKLSRELKVKKYLQKKQKRTYEKKVHYQVRQKVAGERMRIRGRFITWREAVKLIDTEHPESWTYSDYFQIKNLLYAKFNKE